MRYWISAMLLASAAAMPAYAQDAPQEGHHNGRGDGGGHDAAHYQQAPQGGHDRAAPPAQAMQPRPQAPQSQARPPMVSQGASQGGRFDGGHPRPQGSYVQGGRPDMPMPQGGASRNDGHDDGRPDGRQNGQGDGRGYGQRSDNGVRVWQGQQGDHRGNSGGWNGQGRPVQADKGGYDRGGYPQGGRPGHDGRNDGGRGGNDGGHYNDGGRGGADWNRGWRGDHRYDWQGWRQTHRDIFRGGSYRPPYRGWGYRRFEVGVGIDPVFFGEQYWINDPGYYRLPPAYGPYRWVRYYNDALLIDLEDGVVVDEIPDFFW